jgi:hypothetical protein
VACSPAYTLSLELSCEVHEDDACDVMHIHGIRKAGPIERFISGLSVAQMMWVSKCEASRHPSGRNILPVAVGSSTVNAEHIKAIGE